MPPPFPPELVAPMISAAITMLVLVCFIFVFAAKRIIISLIICSALIIWLGAAFSLSQNGFFLKLSLWPLPNIGLLFLPMIVGIMVLAKSTAFQKVVDSIFQPWLIGAQVMRVMGVSFLMLHARGLMPAEFALPSGIGDVVVGSTAPIVALILFFKLPFGRKLAIAWNSIGFAELTAAIVTGFLTSPTPYQLLAFDNPNWFLFDFPIALVPTFAVPLSLLLHIYSLRVLFKNPNQ